MGAFTKKIQSQAMNSILIFMISCIGLCNSQNEFQKCVNYVRRSSPQLGLKESDKLKVYGLFKQASEGDCDLTLRVGDDIYTKTKHDAWCKEFGKPSEVAKLEYIAKIDEIAPQWRNAVIVS